MTAFRPELASVRAPIAARSRGIRASTSFFRAGASETPLCFAKPFETSSSCPRSAAAPAPAYARPVGKKSFARTFCASCDAIQPPVATVPVRLDRAV